jgi:hypothetical protein
MCARCCQKIIQIPAIEAYYKQKISKLDPTYGKMKKRASKIRHGLGSNPGLEAQKTKSLPLWPVCRKLFWTT